MEQWKIREGMEVRSADDEKLGKVVACEDQYLVVEKGFFFPTDYYVPTSAISTTDEDTIYLSVTKDEALNSGWDQQYTTETTTSGYESASGYASSAGAATAGTIGGAYDTAGRGTEYVGDEETLRVPVHEEELTATKRPVDQGQVRIEKDVVAEERTLEVPVTEERVHVTRRTVDREGVADDTAFTEGTIEVPVRGEEVDLEKRVRVAEEVEIAKEPVRRTEQVGGTVRREEVRIEDQTEATGSQ